MKCVLTQVASNGACAWCNRKTECVETSIEGTFFKKSSLCWKCLQKAIGLRYRQESQQANAEKSTSGTETR
jgi:hypothetical protein